MKKICMYTRACHDQPLFMSRQPPMVLQGSGQTLDSGGRSWHQKQHFYSTAMYLYSKYSVFHVFSNCCFGGVSECWVGHIGIPHNDILYKNKLPMGSHLSWETHFSYILRVAAHSRLYCNTLLLYFCFDVFSN